MPQEVEVEYVAICECVQALIPGTEYAWPVAQTLQVKHSPGVIRYVFTLHTPECQKGKR